MSFQSVFKKLKKINDIYVTQNEPLKKHTTLKVGGKARLFIIPKTKNGLIESLKILNSGKIPVIVIGNASNILVFDNDIKKAVIKIGGGLNFVDIKDSTVRVGAGVGIQKLLVHLKKAGLSGLEFASGVPASVGGAVIMNMGAFGKEISKFVKEVKALTFNGREKIFKKNELNFDYRSSSLKNKRLIITEAVFKLKPVDKKTVKKRIEKVLALRKEKQPLSLPNAGSIFKNPPGNFAGKIIEGCGLKGIRIGDAQVSTKHANFIVNLGDAKARDVYMLIKKVQRIVKEKTKVELKPEIEVIRG